MLDFSIVGYCGMRSVSCMYWLCVCARLVIVIPCNVCEATVTRSHSAADSTANASGDQDELTAANLGQKHSHVLRNTTQF